ncbi:hypothetical protein V3C99_012525 [Haemonchus contortus]|nr:unnamed protein product [Haemonchus contortus]
MVQMHWLKENAVRVVMFIMREPMLFVQYLALACLAMLMFTLVMQYKIQKSFKKQEKLRKQKEKILRKLHGNRNHRVEEAETQLTLEKNKDV